MGRMLRTYSFSGYLIGDLAPVMQNLLDMAIEAKGPGLLMHPTIGALQVGLLSSSTAVQWDKMRVIQVEFEFIEVGAFDLSAGDHRDRHFGAGGGGQRVDRIEHQLRRGGGPGGDGRARGARRGSGRGQQLRRRGDRRRRQSNGDRRHGGGAATAGHRHDLWAVWRRARPP